MSEKTYIEVGRSTKNKNRFCIVFPHRDEYVTTKALSDEEVFLFPLEEDDVWWLATELLGRLSEDRAVDAYDESFTVREEEADE